LNAADERIAAAIFALLAARAADGTICPSEAARALAGDEAAWRALMPEIRRVAAALAQAGSLRVTQHGEEVDALTARGPIRLGRPLERRGN
jgi:hypothetical protein